MNAYIGCNPEQGYCSLATHHSSLHCYPRYVELEYEGRGSDVMSFAEWSEVATFPPQLPTTCEWVALCSRPANGVVSHPVLGDVPTCVRCARRLGLSLVFPTPGHDPEGAF